MNPIKKFSLFAVLSLVLLIQAVAAAAQGGSAQVKKLEDVVVYRDPMYYSAFPSLVVRPDGEILCAFRRAPDRRALWNAPANTHTDANSYCVLVRSADNGRTWTREPELISAHPLGGSQDPCMVQLRDGTIVCASYTWALIPPEGIGKVPQSAMHGGSYAFLGGYLVRSENGGRTWSGPIVPMALPGDQSLNALGKPVPAYNRGAMIERRDGRLSWVVVRADRTGPNLLSVHLIDSADKGNNWTYGCPVAEDTTVSFNETSLIETRKGDLVAFIRTADFGGKAAYARSTDGGKSFTKWRDAGFVGHPFHPLQLKDGRVFLVYGYRQPPFGIRAKLLNPDCSDIETAPEIVLRDDGGSGDIGYPWAALLADGRVLVAYYFNVGDGTRHIAATLVKIDPK